MAGREPPSQPLCISVPPAAIAFPRGEGAPVRTLGRMRNGDMWVNICTSDKQGIAMEQNKDPKSKSQELRRKSTKEENLLWYRFLRRYPAQFRRQYVIGNYIVDFYCHKAKLVVELDGSQHCEPEGMKYDQARTAYLESLGLWVLRFSNLDVLRRFANVCEAIDFAVKSRVSET